METKKKLKNLVLVALGAVLFTGTAFAQDSEDLCYVDFKAKKDNPLKLMYGVVVLNGEQCNKPAFKRIERIISSDGWKLLRVLGEISPEEYDEAIEKAHKVYE